MCQALNLSRILGALPSVGITCWLPAAAEPADTTAYSVCRWRAAFTCCFSTIRRQWMPAAAAPSSVPRELCCGHKSAVLASHHVLLLRMPLGPCCYELVMPCHMSLPLNAHDQASRQLLPMCLDKVHHAVLPYLQEPVAHQAAGAIDGGHCHGCAVRTQP